jgi:hypothetical protein
MVNLPYANYWEVPLDAGLFLAGLREAAVSGFSTIPAWSRKRCGGPAAGRPPQRYLS